MNGDYLLATSTRLAEDQSPIDREITATASMVGKYADEDPINIGRIVKPLGAKRDSVFSEYRRAMVRVQQGR